MDCVESSFVKSGSATKANYEKDDNIHLKEMQAKWKKYGTHSNPSLVINDVTFRGQLSPFNAFEAICAGFPANKMPHDCRKWLHMEGIELDEEDDGLDFSALIVITLVLIVINAILIFFYRRWV